MPLFKKPLVHSAKPKLAEEGVEQDFQKRMKQIKEEELEKETRAQADLLGYGYTDLHKYPILLDTLALLPQEFVEKYQVISFLIENDTWHIAVKAPLPTEAMSQIQEILPKSHSTQLAWFLISDASFKIGLKQYSGVAVLKRVEGGVEVTASDLEKYQSQIKNFRDLQDFLKGLSVSEMLTVMLAGGLKAEASDIHIEAEEAGIKVRYRIDGVLYSVAELPHEDWHRLVSRIKLLAGLKINIIDKPQDGHFTIFLSDDKLEVRVSCIPTNYGESVALRLLRGSVAGLKFEDLGISGKALEQIMHEISRPNGMVVSCGPTGSGKTTTLYAILNKLNSPESKIVTLEDPIEYKLPGINQSQVDAAHGYTFVSGLRSALRQDPDLIMVGEIRDLETAEVSINAALTGHLVLTTIHTNSASGTLPRFLSMGVKSFLLAPALNVVVGQRLVRRLCQKCKQKAKVPVELLARAEKILGELAEGAPKGELVFYTSAGCEACAGLGYKGRVGLFEVFTISKEIEAEILKGQMSEYTIQEIAVKQGMVTMAQDGLLKALQGVTSVDEVFRVTE